MTKAKECREKRHLSFLPPWEFQTPISSSRTPDPPLLWDPRTSYQRAYSLSFCFSLRILHMWLVQTAVVCGCNLFALLYRTAVWLYYVLLLMSMWVVIVWNNYEESYYEHFSTCLLVNMCAYFCWIYLGVYLLGLGCAFIQL